MTTLLAIDPGSNVMGYAVLRLEGFTPIYLDSGILKLKPGSLLELRLGQIVSFVDKLVRDYKPAYAAVEQTILGSHFNVRSALSLAESRGAAIGAIASHDIPVRSVLPQTWRQIAIGDSHADKQATIRSIMLRFSGDDTFPGVLKTDQSDALGIAVWLASQVALEI